MDPRATHHSDLRYPARLAILADAPETLWVAGPWLGRSARAVSIVGARAASQRGLELAHQLARGIAAAGVDVISGGALGIDAAAHEGALAAGGVTVAVLGTGVDVVYPERHRLLYEAIRESGALLTQFPPGTSPRRGHFPVRNRLIAALGDVVIVVEASISSGSLHTAKAARSLGRRLLAVPGSAGTDQLILDGATAVMSATDVLCVLEGRESDIARPSLPDDIEARRLYDALDGTPRDVGDLAFRAGLAIGTCAARVHDLEALGLCARATGGRYVRLR